MFVCAASVEEAVMMASRLRSEDVREIASSSGLDPEQSLRLSLALSRDVRIVAPSRLEQALAIFGVSDDPWNEGMGVVWLLATDAVATYAKGVLEVAQMYLDYYQTLYPSGLHNLVDTRNTQHLRWCRLCGFRETEEVLLRGQPFIHILRTETSCAIQ